MKPQNSEANKGKPENADTVRASITFPADVYETLELIAKEKKYRWRGWSGTRLTNTLRTGGRYSGSKRKRAECLSNKTTLSGSLTK
jgi:hypothetical protein